MRVILRATARTQDARFTTAAFHGHRSLHSGTEILRTRRWPAMAALLWKRTCVAAAAAVALLSVSGGYGHALAATPPDETTRQLVGSSPLPLPYPLNRQQAVDMLSSGLSVAGRYGTKGLEGFARQSTETAYRDKQVRREKCGYEYDYYKRKDVWKCHDEYVTEKVPYEKTVYTTTDFSDLGTASSLTFSSAAAAIGHMSGLGVTAWRHLTP
ncbi:hypothetical protein ACIBEA_14865 [Streptomyces sp. NPDC051555]|uniref:hypothetical protein n=1 Tax=Streptomyces sp. NPDC051555 TaxID=3365657 RepID=UPI0037A9C76D